MVIVAVGQAHCQQGSGRHCRAAERGRQLTRLALEVLAHNCDSRVVPLLCPFDDLAELKARVLPGQDLRVLFATEEVLQLVQEGVGRSMWARRRGEEDGAGRGCGRAVGVVCGLDRGEQVLEAGHVELQFLLLAVAVDPRLGRTLDAHRSCPRVASFFFLGVFGVVVLGRGHVVVVVGIIVCQLVGVVLIAVVQHGRAIVTVTVLFLFIIICDLLLLPPCRLLCVQQRRSPTFLCRTFALALAFSR